MKLSHPVLLFWAMALTFSAHAGSHGTLDDLIELNAEYAQFEAAIHDLSVPQLSLAAERLRQLLGLEPGEQFPGPTGAVASEREASADIDTCWRRTRAAPVNLNRGGLAAAGVRGCEPRSKNAAKRPGTVQRLTSRAGCRHLPAGACGYRLAPLRCGPVRGKIGRCFGG